MPLRQQIELQKREVEMTEQKLREMEESLKALEQKKNEIVSRVEYERNKTQAFAKQLFRSAYQKEKVDTSVEVLAQKAKERLLSFRLKEIEALRIDLEDANTLSRSIEERKGEIRLALEDLEQSKWVLAANKKFDTATLVQRLEKIKVLRGEDAKISSLIQQFSARNEISQLVWDDKTSLGSQDDPLKGKLAWPVTGKVLAAFGSKHQGTEGIGDIRVSRGIELQTNPRQEIYAPAQGVVSFVGEVPSLGRVVIVNHGRDYYSILGLLGEVQVERGQKIQKGDRVGLSEMATNKVYFEWRSRNIPVNPTDWLEKL